MSSDNADILKEAIARGAGIVLSLPSAGLLRHHKSRFLAEDPDGIWVESVPVERPLVEELVRDRQSAGISFKNGTLKVIFSTPVLRFDPEHQINAETLVQAMLVVFPTHIKAIQRRSNYRVAVGAGSDLSVKVWRIAERAYLRDRPMASQFVRCVLRDISLGGLGVTFQGENGAPPKVTEEDRLRVEVTWGGAAFLVEGRMRKPTAGVGADPATILTGITFKPLDHDLEGRQTLAQLTRIVGTLQREEVRRHRLGGASA
jgi:c-di-GMP-binding flagellar brake protein YcgR